MSALVNVRVGYFKVLGKIIPFFNFMAVFVSGFYKERGEKGGIKRGQEF